MSTIYTLDLDYDFALHCAVPESFQRIRDEGISPDLLEDELAKAVYGFQLSHVRTHFVPAQPSVLEHEFDELVLSQPQTVIDDCIARLRERYARNEARESILNITAAHVNDPTALVSALLDEGRRLHGLLTRRGDTFGSTDYDKAIKRYHKHVAEGRGASMGFKELDDHFYGQKGLTFMVGAPKSYKSWFTVKAVHENIMQGKHPYLYSLELPADESDARLRCLAAKVPYWKYLKHCMDPHDIQAWKEASEKLDGVGSYTIEKPSSGQRTVGDLVQRGRDAGADCIFIDQLQYVENRRGVAVGATNDTKDYFEVINDFRDLSDIGPLWVVHQFNRSIMNADSMPEMQQIKGSAAVEECATLALGLWADKPMRQSHLVQLGTLTARNYGYKAWQASIHMDKSCGIDLVGEVDDE